MAKIIEKGEKIYNCHLCGCKFTLDKEDIKWDDMAMYWGGFLPHLEDCATAKCPQCGEKIVVKWYN